MPIAAERPPVLSSHLAGNADDPGPEPIGLPQPREVSIGPQETLLRQVARARRASRDPVNDGPHEPRVPVVETAERLAIAGPNSRHQVCISRFVVPQHHRTSGRAPRIVQEKQKFLWSETAVATRHQRLDSTRGWGEASPDSVLSAGEFSCKGRNEPFVAEIGQMALDDKQRPDAGRNPADQGDLELECPGESFPSSGRWASCSRTSAMTFFADGGKPSGPHSLTI